ncbi:hypothetical protein MMC25_002622 [Agyrium rufum]|nr:hypothetical protein [Agyrium rufum]
MDIPHPRRILLLTPSSSASHLASTSSTAPSLAPLLRVFTPKTESSKEPATVSETPFPEFFLLKTAYYSAKISLWHTTLAIDKPGDFRDEWMSLEGAGEVVQEIGAWVVGFERLRDERDLADLKRLLSTIKEIINRYAQQPNEPPRRSPASDERVPIFTPDTSASRKGEIDQGSDADSDTDLGLDLDDDSKPLLLAISLPPGNPKLSSAEIDNQKVTPQNALSLEAHEWEEIGDDCGGWEFIDGCLSEEESKGRNEFGEKLGIPRLIEALEAHEWSSPNLYSAPMVGVGLHSSHLQESLLDSDVLSQRTSRLDSAAGEERDGQGAVKDDDTFVDLSRVENFGDIDAQLWKPILEDADPIALESLNREDELEDETWRIRDSGAPIITNSTAVNTSETQEIQEGRKEEGEGGDSQVQELESLMLRMQAVRDQSSHLSPTARRAFAARAVDQIMRDM